MRRILGWIVDRSHWPILGIPMLLMGWARFGATPLGLASFDSATLYAGPYRASLPAGPDGPAVAERVVLVVVDGLRRDVSETLPFLNQLRAAGSDRTLFVGEPSLSFPGWTAIATGAWQEASGFASNFVERPVEIDSLFRAVGRIGRASAIVGSEGWDQLFGGQATRVVTVAAPEAYTDLEAVLDHDRRVLAAALEVDHDAPGLLVVHFPGVDVAGHGWGGASGEYRQTARQVDGLIRDLAASLDLATTTLIVTADHGHTDRGGHSGPEPEVLRVPMLSAGAGVRPGAYADASQTDLAPTVAILLGASIPAHNQGRPLLDQLSAPEPVLAARVVDVADQVTRRYRNLIEIIAPEAAGPDPGLLEEARQALVEGRTLDARLLALRAIDRAEARWREVRSGRLNRERAGRAGVALLLLLPAIGYGIWWGRRRWNLWASALGAAVYLLLWNVNYHLVQRLTYSASWFNNDSDIEPFLTARVIEALIATAAAVLLVAWWRRRERGEVVARDVAHTLLLIGLAQMVQILIYYVTWGVTYSWHLPDFSWGFKYYLDVFQTTAAWPMRELPAAAILVIAAPGFAWLVHTIEGGFRRSRA